MLQKCVPTPVINHPPALTRRPSLTKEGSLVRIGRSLSLRTRMAGIHQRKMPMEATMFMKIKGLRGNSGDLPEIVSC